MVQNQKEHKGKTTIEQKQKITIRHKWKKEHKMKTSLKKDK